VEISSTDKHRIFNKLIPLTFCVVGALNGRISPAITADDVANK